MKKIIALVLSTVIALSVLAIGVSATTKADLLTEAAKSPAYKYVQVAVENAAKTVNITDEQAAQVLPYVQHAVAALNMDNGPTLWHKDTNLMYGYDLAAIVEADIFAVCDILGYTYTFEDVANAKHAHDIIFKVFNADGKLIFAYDGDLVADTSAASDATLYLVAAVALLGLGVTAVILTKKKVND